MNISYGILLIFGISIFGGLVSAFAAKKMKIPQVIGYIITGIIIGESGFKIVSSQEIIKLAPFNFFCTWNNWISCWCGNKIFYNEKVWKTISQQYC